MTASSRCALHRVIAAATVLILLLAAASCGSDDGDDSTDTATPTATAEPTGTPTETQTPEPSATANAEPTSSPTVSPTPTAEPTEAPTEIPVGHINVEWANGGVVGGVGRASVPTGEPIVLTVTADVADEVHVHGYDLYAGVAPGMPAVIEFNADLPGVWEVELEGTHQLILELEVS